MKKTNILGTIFSIFLILTILGGLIGEDSLPRKNIKDETDEPNAAVITPVIKIETTNLIAGQSIYFNASGSWSDMGPITYYLNFGDGSNSYQAETTHTYSEAGEYTVTLTVNDSMAIPSTISEVILVDDAYEDNDYYYDAYSLYPGGGNNQYDGLRQIDEDFYDIEVPANYQCYIEIQINQGSTSDFSMYWADFNDGNTIQVASQIDSQHLGFNFPASEVTENYLIRITGINTGFQYDLNIELTAEIDDDEYEDHDSRDNAYFLGDLNNNAQIEIDSAVQADEDWYKINFLAEGNINVYISGSESNWFVIELYDKYIERS